MQQKCSLFSFFLFTITYLLERSKFKFDDEEIFWFQYFYTSARHITRFLIITPSSNCREKAIKSFKSSLTEGGEFEAMMQVKKSIGKIILEDRGKTFFNNSSRWIYFIFFYPIFFIYIFFFLSTFPKADEFFRREAEEATRQNPEWDYSKVRTYAHTISVDKLSFLIWSITFIIFYSNFIFFGLHFFINFLLTLYFPTFSIFRKLRIWNQLFQKFLLDQRKYKYAHTSIQ